MATEKRNLIFISYHRKDQPWLDQLETHLKPLLRGRALSVWNDTKVSAGAAQWEERAAAVAQARVAVVLVSPDYLASDVLMGQELPDLLAQAEVKLLALPVRPSVVESTPLADYKPLLPYDQSLSMTPEDSEKRLVAVAKRILEACESRARPTTQDSRYERDYLEAVIRQLNKMTLYAVRHVSAEVKEHPLTTAYVSLGLGTREDGAAMVSSLTIDEAMALMSRSSSKAEQMQHSAVRGNLLLIVGDAGRGKTTLLRWIAVQAASRLQQDAGDSHASHGVPWDQRVPFFRSVRLAKDGSPVHDVEHLACEISSSLPSSQPKDWVRRVLQSGRGMVLLDGIDEVPPGNPRTTLLDGIKQLVEHNQDTLFVISSRPDGIKDVRRELSAIGFREARVQPLAGENLLTFMEHWHKAVADAAPAADDRQRRIAEIQDAARALPVAMAAVPHIKAVAATPLLAALICAFHLDRKYLPGNRNELMKALVESLVHLHDANRPGMPRWPAYETLSEDDKILILGALAAAMVKRKEPVIPYDEEARETKELDRHINLVLKTSAQLRESDLPALRKGLRERTGIFREARHGALDFVHLEFRDYLAGQHLIRRAGDKPAFDTIVASLGNADRHGLFYFAVSAPRTIQARGVTDKLASKLLTSLKSAQPEQRGALRRLAFRLSMSDAPVSQATHRKLAEVKGSILPPATPEDAELVAELGDSVVSQLTFDRARPEAMRLACVRSLRMIDTPKAHEALVAYAEEETSRPVIVELAHCVDPWTIGGLLRWMSEPDAPHIQNDLWSRLLASAVTTNRTALGDEARNAWAKASMMSLGSDSDIVLFREAVAALGIPTALTSLDLSFNKVTDEGVKALAASTSLPALASLILTGTEVTDEGVKAIPRRIRIYR